MRPRTLLAGAVLTAALAVVALPGQAGSRTPSPDRPIPVAALQTLRIDASEDRSSSTIDLPDPAYRSASAIAPDTRLVERPLDAVPVPGRTAVKLPKAQSAWAYKPARYTLAGEATWYGNGTTAMRLPFGTVVVICGAGGCVERTVSDWGPQKTSRVVDMTPSDFVRTCGCSLGTGIQNVTVRVY